LFRAALSQSLFFSPQVCAVVAVLGLARGRGAFPFSCPTWLPRWSDDEGALKGERSRKKSLSFFSVRLLRDAGHAPPRVLPAVLRVEEVAIGISVSWLIG
jgi:hypothetical protein